jgi:CRISPR-associated endonuclease Csy4
MDHYVDLKLLRDPEIAQSHLMGALFSRLHLTLVAQRSQRIGISFPTVQNIPPWLGDCLRLHGSQVDLVAMMATPWLASMRDHVQTSAVLPAPTTSRFRVVSRVQAKSNPDRLRRRQMRRHGLDATEASARVPENTAERLDLPYVQLRSLSTLQSFKLFIRHGAMQAASNPGVFSAYGLSPTATVPWF